MPGEGPQAASAASTCRALPALAARSPPPATIDGVAASIRAGHVLPNLRHRPDLEHSPAEYVRRPHVPLESPTLGLSHLQFEAILTAGRHSANPNDFALVAMLGLLGLRVFEATGSNVQALGEARGHRVLTVHGKGDKTALVPLPPAVGRAIDQAIAERTVGPILLNRYGRRMDRHAATRRLRALARSANVTTARMHPHMLRHTFVTTMLDAGVDLRDVQIAARHADPRTTAFMASAT
ncbi:tyrosine-type recombinase/integrase [Nocardioides sp. zg-1228]|uniref:tyrosine-type recombinase/integrase n=1 Tax=Nocardioides sp. zg-1228 TaxID=2763008 RepID=UPI001F122800|nr:tyrosine-type recombinase/integrase [Nocardioides sp. zg-1228]